MTGTTSPSSTATATPTLIRFFRMILSSPHEELRIGYSRSDSTTALMKNGRKVSSKPSRRCQSASSDARMRTRLVTSASTRPQASGASCLLLTMCSAIVLRIGESGRYSSSAPAGLGAAAGPGAAAGAGGGGGGGTGGAGAGRGGGG